MESHAEDDQIAGNPVVLEEDLSDRIAVMYLGKIVEMGSYRDLYLNPKHPYTQALLSAIPVPDPKAVKERTILKGDVPSPINPPSGCYFHPRCAYKMEGCNKDAPALKGIAGNHYVACYLY